MANEKTVVYCYVIEVLLLFTLPRVLCAFSMDQSNEAGNTWSVSDLFSNVISQSDPSAKFHTAKTLREVFLERNKRQTEGSGDACGICDAISELCNEDIGECECKSGFDSTGLGVTCHDIDECSRSSPCADKLNTVCRNTEGSFECDCKVGYALQLGGACDDIDECAVGSHTCDDKADCFNEQGSFKCACKAGYTGTGFTCVDEDECLRTTFPCDVNAECSNTFGSFSCACKDEFVGDGNACRACRIMKSPLEVTSDIRNDDYYITVLLRDLYTYEFGVQMRIEDLSGNQLSANEYTSTQKSEVEVFIPGASPNTHYKFSSRENHPQCKAFTGEALLKTTKPTVVVAIVIQTPFTNDLLDINSPQSIELISAITSSANSDVIIIVIGFLPGSVRAVTEVQQIKESETTPLITDAAQVINETAIAALNVSGISNVPKLSPAPTNFSAEALSESAIKLTWDAYVNATMCIVIGRTNDDRYSSITNDFRVTDLQSGEVYSFCLQCLIPTGDDSEMSEEATTSSCIIGFTKPQATTNLNVTSLSHSTIQVEFSSVTDASYFISARDTTTNEMTNFTFTNDKEFNSRVSGSISLSEKPNQEYEICVQNSIQINGNTASSEQVCQNIITGPSPPNLRIIDNSREGTTIGWDFDISVVSYSYRAVGTNGTIEGTVNGSVTSVTFNTNEFILGDTYTYSLTAMNEAGSVSEEVSITRDAAQPKIFNFEAYNVTTALVMRRGDTLPSEKSDSIKLIFDQALSELKAFATIVAFFREDIVVRFTVTTTSPATTKDDAFDAIVEFTDLLEHGFNYCLDDSPPKCDVLTETCNKTGDSTFECACAVGYETKGGICEDNNECDDTDSCGENTNCVNTVGSFECSCKTGFSGNPTLGCVDINECETGDNNCTPDGGQCNNTLGSYSCACRVGYLGDGVTCNDLDECSLTPQCHANAECTNKEGGYTCTCKPGYIGDPYEKCINNNECSSAPCERNNTQCMDNIGSFECVCKNGFVEDDASGECMDVDECSANPCDVNAQCDNIMGDYTCKCNKGFLGSGKGQNTCVNINECFEKTDNCSERATCLDTPGSYNCTCNTNYFGDGTLCTLVPQLLEIEINREFEISLQQTTSLPYLQLAIEVTQNLGAKFPNFTHEQYTFHELPREAPNLVLRFVAVTTDPDIIYESFLDLFHGNEGDQDFFLTRPTTDFNQCVLPNECQEFQVCNYIAGSAIAQCVCPTGYTGADCSQDVDECAEGTDDCHVDAECTNNIGGFTCTCKAPTIGDGKVCGECVNECSDLAQCFLVEGVPTCRCNNGFIGDGKTCVDIDECLQENICAGENEACVNIGGGYDCVCFVGFERVEGECREVDECETNPCPANSICHDEINSFQCDCVVGFVESGGFCVDVNECGTTLSDCDTNATCENTLGSHKCTCKPGFEGNGTVCTDIDECASNPCDLEVSNCLDEINSFKCVCKDGYEEIDEICRDINECDQGLCEVPYACVNYNGGFGCICPFGYEIVEEECVDIDECATDVCNDHATCTNYNGGYTCTCNTGFNETSAGECQDIDECLNLNKCGENANCVNTHGSFACNCGAGYKLSSLTECTDVNECAEFCNGPNTVCTNTDGSFQCQCKENYFLFNLGCYEIVSYQLTINSSYVYSIDLEDPDSEAYKDLTKTIEESMLTLSDIVFVRVTGYFNGSIVVQMEIASTSVMDATQLQAKIEEDEVAKNLFMSVESSNKCLDVECSDEERCVEGSCIDACAGVKCQLNAKCVAEANETSCECESGFEGFGADGICIDQCSELIGYCLNGGECFSIASGNRTCRCTDKFSGSRCETMSSSQTLTIVLGVLAGLLLVLLIAVIIFYCWKKNRRSIDIFDI